MSLFTNENYQNDAILIPDYTVLEVYKDSITTNNSLGYHIMPLQGITDIKEAIEDLVEETKPAGYNNLAILAGNNGTSFNHCIVYCVWYIGTEPSYPAEPTITPLPSPAPQYNIWQELTVNNTGLDTDATLTLTTGKGSVDFYINNDYFKINANNFNTNIIQISKSGILINGSETDDFEINNIPILKSGTNIIKVNATIINNVSISYNIKY